MRGAATGWTCFGLIVFVAWALSSPAWGHIEVGEKNLLVQVADASVIVHARIEESGRPFRSADGKISRPVVRAKVLETLKGGASFDAIVFAQHGHGVADYRAGQEALLFLDRLGSGGELAALAGLPGAPTHVSRQEHDDAYRLTATSRDVLLPAVRDLVRAQICLHGLNKPYHPRATAQGFVKAVKRPREVAITAGLWLLKMGLAVALVPLAARALGPSSAGLSLRVVAALGLAVSFARLAWLTHWVSVDLESEPTPSEDGAQTAET